MESPNENNPVKRSKHIRDKIRASVLLDRLEKNAMGELQPPMDKDQIRSAEIVLRKAIPDLAAMTIGNEEGEDFRIVIETGVPRDSR